MATYKELRQQADELSERADEALNIARTETLVQILISIKEFGFLASELLGSTHSASKGQKRIQKSAVQKFSRAAKYKDPVTGVTWTGAGRQPKWVVGSKDTYLIINQAIS